MMSTTKLSDVSPRQAVGCFPANPLIRCHAAHQPIICLALHAVRYLSMHFPLVLLTTTITCLIPQITSGALAEFLVACYALLLSSVSMFASRYL